MRNEIVLAVGFSVLEVSLSNLNPGEWNKNLESIRNAYLRNAYLSNAWREGISFYEAL